MKKNMFWLAAGLLAMGLQACTRQADNKVSSPDGQLEFTLLTEADGVYYTLDKAGEPILDKSALGFVIEGTSAFSGAMTLEGAPERESADETWETVWGERQFVKDCHNGASFSLVDGEGYKMILHVRMFNDGMAFRYEFPEQEGLESFSIMDEKTTFNFARKHDIWWMTRREPYYEGYGMKTGFEAIDTAYTPVAIEGSDGRFYAIHEANLQNYAKMNLCPTGDRCLKNELTSWKNGVKVYVDAPSVTPWRFLTVADRVGGLVESDIMKNLNEPSKIDDTSWIKPGKYLGIWWTLHKDLYTWYEGPRHGATTEQTMRYIDFAAEHGFRGVLVEGWNLGWAGNWMNNSTGFSFVQAYPDYDFDKIMNYANSKGVQIIIHNETAANTEHYFSQIDSAYTMYSKYGMHYIKTGNVNLLMDGKEEHDSQYGVNRLLDIVKKAAEYQICVDEHEPAMPTGLERTYPNLMTHEAIRGREHDAWETTGGNKPEHTTVVPFLRGLAGPMDYTFGTFDFSNPNYPFCRVESTLGKELALYVVIYSPLQMASDDPMAYEGQTGLSFLEAVPTDWAETKVVDAVIGDYDIVARKDRNSEDWYLGAISDEEARTVTAPLSFLEEGTYTAQIYADAPDADWETNPAALVYSEQTVTSADTLTLHLATSGGTAIRFVRQ